MKNKVDKKRTILEMINLLRSGNIEIRNVLIEKFMPTAEKISSEYFKLGVEKEDIISSAYEGLTIGIERLEKNSHNNYMSVIRRYIERTIEKLILEHYEIKQYICKKDIIKVLKAKRELNKTTHRFITIEEISEKAQVSLERTKEILELISRTRNKDFKNLSFQEQSEIKNGVENPEYELLNSIESWNSILDNVGFLGTFGREIISLKYFENKTRKELLKILKRNGIEFYELRALLKIKQSQYFMSFLKDLNDLDPTRALEEEVQSERESLPKIYTNITQNNRHSINDLIKLLPNDDYEIRETLFNYFLQRAELIAKEFISIGFDEEYLINLAYIGLISGIEKLKEFDYDNYLSVINFSIMETIAEKILEDYRYKIKKDLTKLLSRKPTTEEISLEINSIKEQILEILNNLSKKLNFDELTLKENIKNYTLKI